MKNISISADTKNIYIGFDYDINLLKAVRDLPDRTFDKNTKLHKIKISKFAYNKINDDFIRKFKSEYNIIIENSFKNLNEYYQSIKQKLDKYADTSNALMDLRKDKIDLEIPNYQPKIKNMWHQNYLMYMCCVFKSCLIFADMGTGKTKVSIDYFDYRVKHNHIEKCLVVCKKAAIKNVWQRQIKQFSDYKGYNLRNGLKNAGGGFYLINYDIIDKNIDFLKDMQFDMIVIDESHKIRNPKAIRTKALTELSENINYRICLTGTPKPKSYDSLFSQFYFIDRGEIFGESYFAFMNEYFKKIGNMFSSWYVTKKNTGERIKELMKLRSMSFETHECQDLPPEQIIPIEIELTREQKIAFNNLAERLDGDTSPFSGYITKARQICDGFQYIDNEDGTKKTERYECEKLNNVTELLEDIIDQDEKVIIWTCYQEEVLLIEDELKKLKYDYAKLVGGMSDKKQDQELERIMNSKTCHILLANYQSAAESLDLPMIRYNIDYSMCYDWDLYFQSRRRTRRKGCERFESIIYYTLITNNSIEEDIKYKLDNRQSEHEFLMSLDNKKRTYQINVK
jgi:SNF2 family DNA or RNA helicase